MFRHFINEAVAVRHGIHAGVDYHGADSKSESEEDLFVFLEHAGLQRSSSLLPMPHLRPGIPHK
jgi:hypothetical protein